MDDDGPGSSYFATIEHMFDTSVGLGPQQLALMDSLVVPAIEAHDPGVDYGEVFTRRWVADLVLDLAGYTADRDLGAQAVLEPSCGSGAFLVPLVQRLVQSSRSHGRPLASLSDAICAFDLLEANAEQARKAVVTELLSAGLAVAQAEELAAGWVHTGDFLLRDHGERRVDYIVGNPPYIRLESVPRDVMQAYRQSNPTMRGRADVYVGFIERGLRLLTEGGALAFICADRWMRNQYGAQLRKLITDAYAVDTILTMHGATAFESEVSAYPAVIVLRRAEQRTVKVIEAGPDFGEDDVSGLLGEKRGRPGLVRPPTRYGVAEVTGWFTGSDPWPTGTPGQRALIADLESRFPTLQDPRSGTRVGIGVATGCDQALITSDPGIVEDERLLPLLRAPDTVTGEVTWSGTYLVNPWDEEGLVDLDRFPRLAAHVDRYAEQLRARHIARRRPAAWFRTIDRVDLALTTRPKLVLPDIKASAHPVLDDGNYYPHHNLYFVVSDAWDLEVLGGLLLSDVANLFVGAYCVPLRGGTYRFQAQYLRRIRVPMLDALSQPAKLELTKAFRERDRERATDVAARLYGITSQIDHLGARRGSA